MQQLKRVWQYLLGRLTEASSWGAIGAALVGYGVLDERRWSLILGVLVALLGGVGLRERGAASTAAEKPEVVKTEPAAAPPSA